MSETRCEDTKSQLKPLSLYIHIPFCVKKCLYCDFLSYSASDHAKEKYLQMLFKEIKQWKDLLCGRYYVKTIFIGGGTPTCLTPAQVSSLGEVIRDFCNTLSTAKGIEFTIEANPGTITPEHIRVMKEIGINRVSLGLQSAQNDELHALGRIHTYEDFLKSYDLLQRSDITNINIDLMADIPLQTVKSYEDTLNKVLQLQPQHISSYSLIVEEGTPFYQMQQEHMLQIPDEDTDRKMYELTREKLSQNGYNRYEISNYAKADMECKHNLTYWQLGEYLGFGLGASSYLGGYRFSNSQNMKAYCKNDIFTDIKNKDTNHCALDNEASQDTMIAKVLERKQDCHKLIKREEMEEFVFLGLRMMQGISISEYNRRFGEDFRKRYETLLPILFGQKLLAEDENRDRIYLTSRGIDVSNTILAEFLIDD